MALFRRRRPEVDLDERSPQLGIKYKDLLVLEQLVKAGADMTNPRHVLYYLYFSNREAAETAAAATTERGFASSVREPLPRYSEQWSLVCELHDTVLELDMVRDNTDFFEELAATQGGEYDGWEASAD